MATVTQKSSSQAIDVRLIVLDPNEAVIVHLATAGTTPGTIKWEMGGLSWNARPASGNSMLLMVDYSNYDEGDEDWVEHVDSPFRRPKMENEWGRCQRIRFTNDGTSVINLSVTSNGKFMIEEEA